MLRELAEIVDETDCGRRSPDRASRTTRRRDERPVTTARQRDRAEPAPREVCAQQQITDGRDPDLIGEPGDGSRAGALDPSGRAMAGIDDRDPGRVPDEEVVPA